MSRIGILYICTGVYVKFWADFYKSYEEYFLPNTQKEYFVFTDAEEILGEDNPLVHKIFQKNLGWPDNTLMRFHIFLEHEKMYEKCDYLFYLNANLKCMRTILEEEFLPDANSDKRLVVVQHPGYYNKTNADFAYDRNPDCRAYIPQGVGEYYVAGGCNGGCREDYLRLVRILRDNIDADRSNNIIATWHDESQINRYVYDNDDYIVLDPGFLYPEGWELPFEEKMRLLDKKNYIPVGKVKQDKFVIRAYKKIRYCLGRCKYYFYVIIGKNKNKK